MSISRLLPAASLGRPLEAFAYLFGCEGQARHSLHRIVPGRSHPAIIGARSALALLQVASSRNRNARKL